MVDRLLKLPKSQSFFLFGARGTGKSTLLRGTSFLSNSLQLNLLNPVQEDAYARRPELLAEQCQSLKSGSWVVIDEVQKVPKLLDLVHALIEEKKIKFALTGSSARKLKRGHANLLAGRAVDFGNIFEAWFINECIRLNSYKELDLKFSYLRTKDDVEIDLIVERPNGKMMLIEIKSTDKVDVRHVKSLLHFKKDFRNADLICASRVSSPQIIDGVQVLPWAKVLELIAAP